MFVYACMYGDVVNDGRAHLDMDNSRSNLRRLLLQGSQLGTLQYTHSLCISGCVYTAMPLQRPGSHARKQQPLRLRT